jgi:SPP1 gp7 family putative phage head morphogenesis protein
MVLTSLKDSLFEGSCKVCNGKISNKQLDIFTEDEMNTFLARIFDRSVTVNSLDKSMYQKIARKITAGVYKGYGKNIINTTYNSPDYDMLQSLRENVYIFSGAKTYQQTKDISTLLAGPTAPRTFKEFKTLAKPLFKSYNETYLKVEYNSAIAQARSASQWLEIENDKSIYDSLQYVTAGDNRVRPEHEILNGIIRRVDDKFWDKFMPPNGWACRCLVIQQMDVKETPLTTKNKPSIESVPKEFRFNPGKEKIIFSPYHPYFNVAKSEREYAKRNFDLPLL